MKISILKKVVMTLACLGVFAIEACASAPNIYIAQNAAGAANGADCADAKPVSFFNTSANWGSGSAQIGPGKTAHLCGTFTGAANSTMLTIQGSGASGNPVTILFESGAQLNAPYWGTNGAIYCTQSNYITLNGGSATGTIQNTDNGTNLANQAASTGVSFSECSHVEIENLTVKNIYVHSGTGSDGSHNTTGIVEVYGDFISIHDNAVTYAFNAISLGYGNGSTALTTANIYNNVTDHHCWGLALGDGNNNGSGSGLNVYNNSIGPHFDDYLDAAQTMHADGMIVSAFNSGSTLTNSNFYNNYIQGDMCTNAAFNCTGYLFLTGSMSNINIYNNVFATVSGSYESLLRLSATSGAFSNFSVYNNTFVGNGGPIGIKMDAGSNFVIENNIFTGFSQQAMLGNPGNFNMLGSVDYNVYYSNNQIANGGVVYNTLASWQAAGHDAHGSSSNPLLTGAFAVGTSSNALGTGTNLTSLNNISLDHDKAGTLRPTTGPWVAGAYQSGASANAPAAPAGLTATVQ
jgi:hypothetical protein